MNTNWSFLTLFALVFAIFSTGCAGDYVKTKDVVFYLEKDFNQGQLLPVDVIFIQDPADLKTITAKGPDDWFSSPDRFAWNNKQTLHFRQGDYRKTKVVFKAPKKTVNVIVFADFIQINGPKGQQIVLDAKSSKEESVFLSTKGALHHK